MHITEQADDIPTSAPESPDLLKQHFTLPPLPEIVARLMEMMAGDAGDAGEVADLVTSDPGLVAELLKLVNSAYYGLPRAINQVRHAVAYLGLAQIQRIVLSASVMKTFDTGDAVEQRRFWAHSFYVALTSRVVARHFEPTVDPETLYAPALLHDIGQLVCFKFFPEQYRRIREQVTARQTPFADVEKDLEVPSHGQLGAELAEAWRLPEGVKECCEKHELEDLRDELTPLQRVVCVSNLMVHLADGNLCEDLAQRVQADLIDVLGCSEQEFLIVMAEVYDLRMEVISFLDQL